MQAQRTGKCKCRIGVESSSLPVGTCRSTCRRLPTMHHHRHACQPIRNVRAEVNCGSRPDDSLDSVGRQKWNCAEKS